VSVVAYLPVFRVAFAYQVKQGRSWTPLEHMLLWRLAEGKNPSEALAREAGLPPRLIVEALINLMKAGWAQVGGSGDRLLFEASDLGRRVLKSRALPPDTRLRRRGMTLLMDRLTNEFIVPEDVTVVHRERIPDNALVIEPRAFKLTVDPQSCLERLDVRASEVFEQWIDYRVTSQAFHIQLAVAGGEILGLPHYASPELRTATLEEVGSGQEQEADADAQPAPAVAGREFGPAPIEADDLIVGGSDHREALQNMLGRARSTFVLHSCFITESGIKGLLPALVEAAKRGVRTDLLWGLRQEGLDEKARRDLAKALAATEKVPRELRPRIMLSERETGSHAKLLIADSGPSGKYEAIVGSCNWLSTLYSKVEVSLRIRHQWMVGEIAALVAALRMPPSGRWSQDVHRIVQIRNACMAAPRTPGNGRARLVLDGEHLLSLREARDEAEDRIVAGCDLLGQSAEISVFTPMRGATPAAPVELLYAAPTPAMKEQEEQAVRAMEDAGLRLNRRPDLHGKFMLWDDADLLVTSFNWLATKADPWKPKGAEIGIHLRAPGFAQTALQRIRERLEPGQGGLPTSTGVPAT
jgi:hypothetical protein